MLSRRMAMVLSVTAAAGEPPASAGRPPFADASPAQLRAALIPEDVPGPCRGVSLSGAWACGASYELDVDPDARRQIMALPTHALTSFADAMAMLELTPWNGAPLHKDNPGGAVRTLPFGLAGMITYLILDDLQRRDT